MTCKEEAHGAQSNTRQCVLAENIVGYSEHVIETPWLQMHHREQMANGTWNLESTSTEMTRNMAGCLDGNPVVDVRILRVMKPIPSNNLDTHEPHSAGDSVTITKTISTHANFITSSQFAACTPSAQSDKRINLTRLRHKCCGVVNSSPSTIAHVFKTSMLVFPQLIKTNMASTHMKQAAAAGSIVPTIAHKHSSHVDITLAGVMRMLLICS